MYEIYNDIYIYIYIYMGIYNDKHIFIACKFV